MTFSKLPAAASVVNSLSLSTHFLNLLFTGHFLSVILCRLLLGLAGKEVLGAESAKAWWSVFAKHDQLLQKWSVIIPLRKVSFSFAGFYKRKWTFVCAIYCPRQACGWCGAVAVKVQKVQNAEDCRFKGHLSHTDPILL